MKILGVRVDGEKKTNDFELFDTADVLKVDTINISGHSGPRYHTRKAAFVGIQTLAEVKDALNLVQLDNGTLARMDEMQFIVDYGQTLTAHFKGSDITANVAKSKKRLYAHLIIKPEFIPETY